MNRDWPIFGRDVADAAWRPAADAAVATRLGRFIRATGEPDLEALQRHAERDPAWFWGAAADDLRLDWQRRPTQTLDLSGGVEWSRWWSGGSFNYASAAIDGSSPARPQRASAHLGGRGRHRSPIHQRRAEGRRGSCRGDVRAAGRHGRRPRGHLPAAIARNGDDRPGTWKAESDLHPYLLRLCRSGGCEQAQRRRCHLACHRRRHASPWRQGQPEGDGGRCSRPEPDRASKCW